MNAIERKFIDIRHPLFYPMVAMTKTAAGGDR